MSAISTIQAVLRETHNGTPWHAASILRTLDGVDAKTAAARPPGGRHSIWEIVHHMIAWQRFAVRCIGTGVSTQLQGDEDWPPVIDNTDEAWARAQNELGATLGELLEALDGMDDNDLRAGVPGQKYSFKVLVHGVAQHNAYHQGQIALLKAMACG